MMDIIKSSSVVHSGLCRVLSSLLIGLLMVQAMASPSTDSNSVSCAFTPHLSCSDTRSGQILWSNSHYSDPDNFTIVQSQLYISHSTTSSSFETRTGEPVWQVSSGSDAHYFYPVISGKSVLLARTDGVLEKRQADSGELIWSRSLDTGWVYPPLVQQGSIITGGQDRIIWVLDSQTGKTRKIIHLDQELVAPLFQVGNRFIASTFDGQLRAFRLDQNTLNPVPLWQRHLGAPAFSWISNSRYLVIADMGGDLHALDPETGRLRWQKTIYRNAQFWNVLYQKNVINLTESGSLTILDVENGQLLQQMQFENQYIQGPVVTNDKVDLYDTYGVVHHLTPYVLPNHSD